jgi:gamma-glutamylcyclotransferase (GGCT)/AIG2-like uncharacterized protein YtfP
MSNKTINDDTFISEFTDVNQWKKHRIKLIEGILSNDNNESEWRSAFDVFFYTRIKTRFLNPIDWILEKQYNNGEGFSAVALQCVLIEFLEAFYQGKIYTTSKSPRDFEYNSSKQLFCDFLLTHKPFSDEFITKANANGFFDNIRCGLLHEAATKETSRINNAPSHYMLVSFEPNDPSNMRIYRENFYQGICEYIDSYKTELLTDKSLKANFIRKMDDICGIKHEYYFAYGSNMYPERLLERIKKYHKAFPAKLNCYKFIYNKKSKDGTAKANIELDNSSIVHGVCFEIDEDDFSVLSEFEKGYDRKNNIEIITADKTMKAVTYISSSIDNTLTPSNEYKKLTLKGADFWKLDKSYIEQYLI